MKKPKNSSNVFPQFNKIASIDDNVILNKSKDISAVYRIKLPEIFTLGEDDFDSIHSDFLKMFNSLPEGTIVHKKDIFIHKTFDNSVLENETYLQKSVHSHFNNRVYMEHDCLISFIMPDVPTLRRNYDKIEILTKKNTIAAIEEVEEFLNNVEQAINVLNTSAFIEAIPLTQNEVYDNVFNEYALYDHEIGDITTTKDELKIGNKEIRIFSLRDDAQQKDGHLTNCVIDRERTTDITKFFRSYCYPLGLELNANHIYNQYIFLEYQDIIKNKLESTNKKLLGSSLLNRKNSISSKKNDEFLTNIEAQNVKIVRLHSNLIIWDENKEVLNDLSKKVKGIFSKMDIVPYLNNHFDRDYIYIASQLGCGGLLPYEETFISYLDLSLCYYITETNYKSDKTGIVYNDRIYQVPIYVDLFNEPYEKKLINNRNYIIIAPSGGGKSVNAKHKIRHQIENPNNSTVVLNIGGDDKMCRMYPEDTLYFKYVEGQALNLNPFWVEETITSTKIEFIIDFIGLLWKTNEELTNDDRSGLDKIIFKLYKIDINEFIQYQMQDSDFVEKQYRIVPGKNRSLLDFFNFLIENKEEIKKYTFGLFDVDSLILNLEKYAVGIYSTLFTSGKPQNFSNKKYIEFELDNIKDNPILFPIFGMVIADLILNTVWKDDGKEKDFFIDEAWKVIEKKGIAVLLKYLYKTIRKFNGSVGIAIQQITDLLILPEADQKAILGNTAVKLILDHREVLSDIPILKEMLSLSNADISTILSIQNKTKYSKVNPRPHTEQAIKLGSQNAKIVRLELTKECLAIYESDKNKLRTFDTLYKFNNKNIIPTIEDYIEVEINKTKTIESFQF